MEFPVAFPVETCPQIGDEDLGSLVESDSPALERGLVPEAGEALCQQVDQSGGGVVGVVNAVGEAALEVLSS